MSIAIKRLTPARFGFVQRAANHQARITRDRALLAGVLAVPIYIAFAAVNYGVHSASSMAATNLVAAFFALCAIAFIRYSPHASIGGHLSTLALSAQVFGETAFNGGLQAPAIALSLLIVPAAIFTAGPSAVRPWAILTVSALAGIFMLDSLGKLPPNELNADALAVDRILTLAAGIFITAALVIQFDRQAKRAIDSLLDERSRYRHRALHDSLTGLPNRSFFYEHAEKSIEDAREKLTHRLLIYFDIDRFKQINDQYGHAIGDALLIAFASRVSRCVRPGDLVARLAGDEFVIISDSASNSAMIEQLTNRLRSVTDDPFELDAHMIRVGISIGSSRFPSDGSDLDELLKIADANMYSDKTVRRELATHRNEEVLVNRPTRNDEIIVDQAETG